MSGQPITPTPIQPVQVISTTGGSFAPSNQPVRIEPALPVPGVDSMFTQLGFTVVGSEKCLFITGEGGTASGKTRFLTTCPPPIGVVDFDKGMKGVAEFDCWGGRIVRKTLELPDFVERGNEDKRGMAAPAVSATERALAVDTYEQFKEIMRRLFRGLPKGATVGVDNGGAIYTCAQAARFGQLGKLGDVPSQVWRMMKLEFESIFTEAGDYGINLVVLHRQKEKFGEKGVKELDGYRDMQFAADVHLVFEKRVIPVPMAGPIVPGQVVAIPPPEIQFAARVEKCRPRAALEQREFVAVWLDAAKTRSMGLDFVTIAKEVFPGTGDVDWIRRG